MSTTAYYQTHSVVFEPPRSDSGEKGWRTTILTTTLPTVTGETEGDVTLEFTATSSNTVSKLFFCSATQNTEINDWKITHAYVREIETPTTTQEE